MFYLNDRPHWEEEGRDWPNRAASRFVVARGCRWHVQDVGEGPTVLLLHGTGAATHSYRDLIPLLAPDFRVIAPDLPAHGFSAPQQYLQLSLPNVAASLAALLDAMDVKPALAVGHSAGAAIAARMALDGRIAPRAILSLNGAFLPFKGVAGHIFPSMARMLFLNPLTPRAFAWRAGDSRSIERLIKSTGSQLDPLGLDLYTRLMKRAGHIAGALGMMAHWDLNPLLKDLPRLDSHLALYVSEGDTTVPPESALDVEPLAKSAEIIRARDLGHLAHEEAPETIDVLIRRLAG